MSRQKKNDNPKKSKTGNFARPHQSARQLQIWAGRRGADAPNFSPNAEKWQKNGKKQRKMWISCKYPVYNLCKSCE